ncbi:L-rhamnose mutarotase [Halosimplex amylolyticum]|uniref:L-rhamnose mutarotase n=1 Tax=Halosimplex amylolyticum TaxID=3396616 RepID=UPI003F544E07
MTDHNSTERVAMLQRLDPDHIDDYLEAHEDVPQAVSDAMDRGGVQEFRLFVRDEISVAYFEVDDYEEFNGVYMADPECQEWEERVAAFKQEGVDVDSGEMPLMDEVWTFEAEE